MKQEDTSIELVHRSIRKSGAKVLYCADPLMPDLLALDSNRGLLSIFVFVEGNFLNTEEEVKSLKKRNRVLSEEISILLNTRIFLPLTVLQTPKKGSNRSFVIPSNIFPNESTNTLSESQLELVIERFNPKYTFIKRRRINLADEHLETRQAIRAQLDSTQREVVEFPEKEVLHITGPAGSGKSQVLIARAMRMSRENPDWKIAFITYNKSLSKVTHDQLRDFSNIEVQTFSEFIASRKAKFSFYKKIAGEKVSVSQERTEIELKYIRASGIVRDIDAIFIDEVQDFWPAWLQYCIECQVLGRGGATIAGDSRQALYVRANVAKAIEKYDFWNINLQCPYRNTVEILKFVEMLTDVEQHTENVPHGNLPDLVYVDTSVERNNLNRAVIHDVVSLLRQPGINAGDIAISVTRHHMKYALRGQLQEALDVEFHGKVVVDSIQKGSGDSIDLTRDSIKILTAHSSKGLSFPVVFLLGIDLLYGGEESNNLASEDKNLLLVAPTRACDRLLVYVSNFPEYLSQLKSNASLYSFRIYPEDFLGE